MGLMTFMILHHVNQKQEEKLVEEDFGNIFIGTWALKEENTSQKIILKTGKFFRRRLQMQTLVIFIQPAEKASLKRVSSLYLPSINQDSTVLCQGVLEIYITKRKTDFRIHFT